MCRLQGFNQSCQCGSSVFVPLDDTDNLPISPCPAQCARELEAAAGLRKLFNNRAPGYDETEALDQWLVDEYELLQDARDYDLKWKYAENRRVLTHYLKFQHSWGRLHEDRYPLRLPPRHLTDHQKAFALIPLPPAIASDAEIQQAVINLIDDLNGLTARPESNPVAIISSSSSVDTLSALSLLSLADSRQISYDTLPPARDLPTSFPEAHDYASTHSASDPCFCALIHRLRYDRTGEIVTHDVLWSEWFKQYGNRFSMSTARLSKAYMEQNTAFTRTTQTFLGLYPYNALLPAASLPSCPGVKQDVIDVIEVESCDKCARPRNRRQRLH